MLIFDFYFIILFTSLPIGCYEIRAQGWPLLISTTGRPHKKETALRNLPLYRITTALARLGRLSCFRTHLSREPRLKSLYPSWKPARIRLDSGDTVFLDVGPRRLMCSAKWQSFRQVDCPCSLHCGADSSGTIWCYLLHRTARNMLILVVPYIAVPILPWYNMMLFAGTEPCTNNSYTSAKEKCILGRWKNFCTAR
jgi:hypothetical protein